VKPVCWGKSMISVAQITVLQIKQPYVILFSSVGSENRVPKIERFISIVSNCHPLGIPCDLESCVD
jgi:hypothetical protein